MAPIAALGGHLLWEFEFFSNEYEVEVQHYILLHSQLIFLTLLIPMQLMCLLELEISEVVRRQAESRGRLMEDPCAALKT